MTYSAKILSVFAAVGLLAGTIGVTPVLADKKAEPNIFQLIDADLKALDKELTKMFTPPKK